MMKLVEQLKEERELLRSTTSVSNVCHSVRYFKIWCNFILTLMAYKFCAEFIRQ